MIISKLTLGIGNNLSQQSPGLGVVTGLSKPGSKVVGYT
jgi:hypothetical protein